MKIRFDPDFFKIDFDGTFVFYASQYIQKSQKNVKLPPDTLQRALFSFPAEPMKSPFL